MELLKVCIQHMGYHEQGERRCVEADGDVRSLCRRPERLALTEGGGWKDPDFTKEKPIVNT